MLEPITDLNSDIVTFLTNNGITAKVQDTIVAVDRTSMCNYKLCNGLDEDDSYKMVVELIKEKFSSEGNYITWAGKTDDDYFLTVYNRRFSRHIQM